MDRIVADFRANSWDAYIDGPVLAVIADTAQGDKDFFDDISIKQENGVLTIESSKDRSYKNKIYIGLPVKNLTAIDITAQAFVTGMNPLQSKELLITMYEECVVNLKSTGKIEIRSIGDIAYSFHKKLPREYMNRPRK